MYQTVRDAEYFLRTGIIEHRNTTNTTAMEQFIEELDIQEQLNDTELDSRNTTRANST